MSYRDEIKILIAGSIGVILGLQARRLVIFLAGLATAGTGFGPAFAAALQSLFDLAGHNDRSKLGSAFYMVAYLSIAAPAAPA